MIFKIVYDEDIRVSNNGVDAVPEFKACNDKTLKYIFLMEDYVSPFSRMPTDARKEQVLLALDYTNDDSRRMFFNRNKKVLQPATDKFKRMQYDAEMESLISCKSQMKQWDELLRKEDKTEKEQATAQRIFDKMPSYMRRVKEMEEIVGFREKVEQDDEGFQKTSLEKYLEVQKSRDESSN